MAGLATPTVGTSSGTRRATSRSHRPSPATPVTAAAILGPAIFGRGRTRRGHAGSLGATPSRTTAFGDVRTVSTALAPARARGRLGRGRRGRTGTGPFSTTCACRTIRPTRRSATRRVGSRTCQAAVASSTTGPPGPIAGHVGHGHRPATGTTAPPSSARRARTAIATTSLAGCATCTAIAATSTVEVGARTVTPVVA